MRTPPPRPGSKRIPDQAKAVRAWVLLGAGALVVLVLLWVGTRLLGGGGDEADPPPLTGPSGATGPSAAPFADPPPADSIAAVFPRGANGTRLEVKVVALGDDPDVCVAEGLRLEGEVRSVYHHGCSDAEAIDRAFFLVRVTNLTEARVHVTLDGFTIVGAHGGDHTALAVPPPGVSATRFFPASFTLGVGASSTRWVTIDGSEGERPQRLVYADGPEILTIRFPQDWV